MQLHTKVRRSPPLSSAQTVLPIIFPDLICFFPTLLDARNKCLLLANSFLQFSVQFGCEIHSSIVLVRTSDQLSLNLTGMYRSVAICFMQVVSKSGSSLGFMFDAPGLTSALFELVSFDQSKLSCQYGLLCHLESLLLTVRSVCPIGS